MAIDTAVTAIREIYMAISDHERQMQDSWIDLGRELVALKAEVKQGGGSWMDFVSDNLPFGVKQAAKYIRISKHPEALRAGMSINEAISTIAHLASSSNERSVTERLRAAQEAIEEEGVTKAAAAERVGIQRCNLNRGLEVLESGDDEILTLVDEGLPIGTAQRMARMKPAERSEAVRAERDKLRQKRERKSAPQSPRGNRTRVQHLRDIIDHIRSLCFGFEQQYGTELKWLRDLGDQGDEVCRFATVARDQVADLLDRVIKESGGVHHGQQD